jgi:hypothetical protein
VVTDAASAAFAPLPDAPEYPALQEQVVVVQVQSVPLVHAESTFTIDNITRSTRKGLEVHTISKQKDTFPLYDC